MTDTRHTQPRCPICRWPYRPDGCTPASCCFRPGEHTAEYAANAKRRAAHDRLRDSGNPAPTLEDVDAELAPKGLPVIVLDGPIWVGQWQQCGKTGFNRLFLKPYGDGTACWLGDATIAQHTSGAWTYHGGLVANTSVYGEGHPTPETAQAACEAAIIAAWRNR